MGWERKRGKLEQLVDCLSGTAPDVPEAFIDLGALSALQAGTPYIVTLDADIASVTHWIDCADKAMYDHKKHKG